MKYPENNFKNLNNKNNFKIPISILVVIINQDFEVLLMRRVLDDLVQNNLKNIKNIKKIQDLNLNKEQGFTKNFSSDFELKNQPELWQSVTGSLDDLHESLFTAARREVFEETGLKMPEFFYTLEEFMDLPKIEKINLKNNTNFCVDLQQSSAYKISDLWQHRYAPTDLYNTEHQFLLYYRDAKNIALSPTEHDQYCWLPWQTAAKQCFSPSNQQAISYIFEKILNFID